MHVTVRSAQAVEVRMLSHSIVQFFYIFKFDGPIFHIMKSSIALLVVAALASGARSTGAATETCSAEANAVAEARGHLNSFDSFELTYFDGRGLAEIPRTLLATAGRFPGGAGFTDTRLSSDEFSALKGTGDLAKNLNRAPILNHNGHIIGQSATISRYLARHLGLFGANEADAGQIDSICEHFVDVKAAYRKIIPYKSTQTDDEKKAALALWFDTPATPVLENRKERQLQWFLDQVERFLPGDGYAVGGRPSLADACIFNKLGEHAPELCTDKAVSCTGEPFGDISAMSRTLEKYPKLKAVVDHFKNSPGMKHYLATRGVMKF